MPERRIFARHTPTALTYVSAGAANGGILLNVSEAGCALQLISPPPAMSDVNLELDLGSSLPHVEVAGKVIWADDTGCTGVRFNQLSDAARQTIRRFVESTPADPTMHEIGMELDAQLTDDSSAEPGFEHAEDPLVAEPEEPLFDALEPQSFESRLQELSTGAAFVAIVEECRSATGATASALAMLKGRDMLCRASCGKGAPPNGARLDISSERSFTAQCVSTATTLRCVDSQIDPRVNATVCQRLGIRSVTAMPLMHNDRVVGVLEVFSSERNAFHDGHIAALENLGKIAVEFAISRHEITLPPSQPTPSWPAVSRPAAARPATAPPIPPVQPVTRSAPPFGSSFTGAAAVAVAPVAAKENVTAAAPTASIQQTQPAKPELSIQQKAAPAESSQRNTQAAASPGVAPGASSTQTPAVAPIFTPLPSRSFAPAGSEKNSDSQSSQKSAIAPATSSTTTTYGATSAQATAPSSAQSASKSAASVIEALAAKSSTAAAPALAPIAKPATPQKRESERITSGKLTQPSKFAVAPIKPQPKAENLEIGPLAEEPTTFVGFEYSAGAAPKSQILFEEHAPAAGNRKTAIIAGGAVAVLLIAGGATWQVLRRPSALPAQTVSAAAPNPASQQPDVTVTPSGSAASPASAPDTSSSSTSKDASKNSKSSKDSSSAKSDDSADKSSKKDDKKSTGNKESSSEPKVIALAQTERLQSQPGAAVAPPTITTSSSLPTLLAGAATPSLPSLRVAPPPLSGPLKVSSTAITDHLIRKVDPIYPEMARRSGLSGAVRLRLEIGVDGRVKSATVLEGAPILATSAKDAVMQWRYRPYVVENKPVPIETEIVVRFTGR